MSSRKSTPLRAGRNPLTGKRIARQTDVAARRTQAERLAETRARLLAATTAYIDEHGYHQASLQRVAQAAGVTVGAVQHHFSSKADLLTATVEDNFRQLADLLASVAFDGASLQERIHLFVDHSWQFCNSPRYQASLQILLGMRQESSGNFEHWLNDTLGDVVGQGFALWLRIFRDKTLTQAEHFNIMLYCFSSLGGTALMSRITRLHERTDSDLRELKQLLLLRFSASAQPQRKNTAAAPRRKSSRGHHG